jgi:hypothetical protein
MILLVMGVIVPVFRFYMLQNYDPTVRLIFPRATPMPEILMRIKASDFHQFH